MELGRGYIWVGRGGLINVALCDCRSEYKRNCYLWMPTSHLASLLPCPAKRSRHRSPTRHQGIHLSLSKTWEFRHSDTPHLALEKEIQISWGLFQKIFITGKWSVWVYVQTLDWGMRPWLKKQYKRFLKEKKYVLSIYLQKLHSPVTTRGVVYMLDGAVDGEKTPATWCHHSALNQSEKSLSSFGYPAEETAF